MYPASLCAPERVPAHWLTCHQDAWTEAVPPSALASKEYKSQASGKHVRQTEEAEKILINELQRPKFVNSLHAHEFVSFNALLSLLALESQLLQPPRDDLRWNNHQQHRNKQACHTRESLRCEWELRWLSVPRPL